FNTQLRGGTAGNNVAMVAYPGETATIGGPCAFGVRTHSWDGSESYWTFAELNFLGIYALGPEGTTGWRIIGNDTSGPNGDGQAGWIGTGHNDHFSFWGNNIHDVGQYPTDALYQAVYLGDVTHSVDFGWNTIKNIGACRGIQTNSSTTGDA